MQKSNQAYEFMRKDLTELSTAVHSESQSLITSSSVLTNGISAVSSTASYLREAVTALVEDDEEEEVPEEAEKEQDVLSEEEIAARMAEKEAAFDQDVAEILKIPESLALAASTKLSSVFHTVMDVLTPIGYGTDPEDDDIVLLPDNMSMSRDRWDLLVSAVQSDPRTYCHEPDGAPEDYESWLEKFNLLDQDVQAIMRTSPDVRQYHAQLVPDQLTFDMFWQRYFYRIEMLKRCESRRALMLAERANSESRKRMEEEEEAGTIGRTGSGRQDVTIMNLKEEAATSPAASAATPATPEGKGSSGTTSDEWEKTSLTDIVDQAAKKLADKLNTLPDTRSDEEMNEWEFE